MTESTIMERLKSETWPQHQEAERQELEQQLVGGTLPQEGYVAFLGQRLRIHEALERCLLAAGERDERIRRLLLDGRRVHQPRIEKDLEHFGRVPAEAVALESTAALIRDIEETAAREPIALLGFFYVFEGSTNGARFIARALRGAYRLDGTAGTQYLDPYGDEQRALWQEFRQTMNGTDFTAAEQDAIVAAARRTFTHMVAIDKALHAHSQNGR